MAVRYFNVFSNEKKPQRYNANAALQRIYNVQERVRVATVGASLTVNFFRGNRFTVNSNDELRVAAPSQ